MDAIHFTTLGEFLMKSMSKIRAGLLAAFALSTSLSALPAHAEPTPHTVTPSIYSSELVAFDSDGRLWSYILYESSRRLIGTGWNSMRDLKIADWNQDNIQDIVAVGDNGNLYLYRGIPTGGFTRSLIGTGWGSYDIEVGHWKQADQYPSIVAVNLDTGVLYNYPNLSGSGLAARVVEGRGWGGSLAHHLADFDTDGQADVIAQESGTGKLYLYRTDGNGNFTHAPTVIGKGWSAMNSIVEISGYGGDHMICNCPTEAMETGLLARTSDGILYHYGAVAGSWQTRDLVGPGWNGYTIAGSETPPRISFE